MAFINFLGNYRKANDYNLLAKDHQALSDRFNERTEEKRRLLEDNIALQVKLANTPDPFLKNYKQIGKYLIHSWNKRTFIEKIASFGLDLAKVADVFRSTKKQEPKERKEAVAKALQEAHKRQDLKKQSSYTYNCSNTETGAMEILSEMEILDYLVETANTVSNAKKAN